VCVCVWCVSGLCVCVCVCVCVWCVCCLCLCGVGVCVRAAEYTQLYSGRRNTIAKVSEGCQLRRSVGRRRSVRTPTNCMPLSQLWHQNWQYPEVLADDQCHSHSFSSLTLLALTTRPPSDLLTTLRHVKVTRYISKTKRLRTYAISHCQLSASKKSHY